MKLSSSHFFMVWWSKLKKIPTEMLGFFVATHLFRLNNVNRINHLRYNHHDHSYSAQQSIARRYVEIVVTALVAHYGWGDLANGIPVGSFSNDPSVASSLKFLRKTPWVMSKVEALYLSS